MLHTIKREVLFLFIAMSLSLTALLFYMHRAHIRILDQKNIIYQKNDVERFAYDCDAIGRNISYIDLLLSSNMWSGDAHEIRDWIENAPAIKVSSVHLTRCIYQSMPQKTQGFKQSMIDMTFSAQKGADVGQYMRHCLGFYVGSTLQKALIQVSSSGHYDVNLQIHYRMLDVLGDLSQIRAHMCAGHKPVDALHKTLKWFIYRSPQDWIFKIGDVTITSLQPAHKDWDVQAIDDHHLKMMHRATKQVLSWSF